MRIWKKFIQSFNAYFKMQLNLISMNNLVNSRKPLKVPKKWKLNFSMMAYTLALSPSSTP